MGEFGAVETALFGTVGGARMGARPLVAAAAGAGTAAGADIYSLQKKSFERTNFNWY